MWHLWLSFACLASFFDLSCGSVSLFPQDLDSLCSSLTDLVLVIVTFSLRKVPASSLQFDYTIAFTYSIYSAYWRTMHPRNDFSELAFLPFAFASGLHSSATLCYISVAVSLAASLGQFFVAVLLMASGLMLVACGTQIELSSATLLAEVQEKQLSMEKLLDHATDGFCEIEVAHGTVTSASSKLEHTFVANGSQLEGMCFGDFLCTENDRAALEAIFHDTSTRRELKPILVTCQSSKFLEFDAKLIPYSSSHCHLKMCIMLLGELRELEVSFDGEEKKVDDEQDGSVIEFLEDESTALHPAGESVLTPLRSDSALSGASSYAPLKKAWGCATSTSSLAYSQTGTELSANAVHLPAIQEACRSSTKSDGSVPRGQQCNVETQTSCSHVALCSIDCQTDGSLMAMLPPRLPARPAARKPYHVNLTTRKCAIKKFKVTPKTTRSMMVMDLVSKVNPCGKGCCFWHVGLLTWLRHFSQMLAEECRKDFVPYLAWQCPLCLVLHDTDDDEQDRLCTVCWSSTEDASSLLSQHLNCNPETVEDDSSNAGDVESPAMSDDGHSSSA